MPVKLKEKNSFDTIKSAVDRAVNIIKPTYGPAANKVIISRFTHKLAVDDGVQIARDLEFEDKEENAVLDIVRETAVRTNDRIGDGTTSSLIVLQAIIEEISKKARIEGGKIEKELKEGLEEFKKQMLAQARPVKTKEDLLKVAKISFNDQKIATTIAEVWHKMGRDGVVTVDRSGTMETISETEEGIKINRGYISPYMVNIPNKMESLIEKPYILITDFRLTEVNDILPIMNELVAQQIFQLVLICDNIEQNALATAIVNKMQGKFNLVAINKPSDDESNTALEDIAMMVGARFFSMKKGDKLQEAKIADLGRAERFISRREESIIVGPKGNKKTFEKAIKDLKTAILLAKTEDYKNKLQARLARITNKVGVIKVGAATENESKALQFKVDDAVNAVHAAYQSGVVRGAGLALANIKTKSEILNQALKAPFRQLKENMGIDSHRPLSKDEAINVVTGEIGNYMKVGVMDPVDVLIAGVESAVSIASILVTTQGMIVEIQEKQNNQN